MNENLSGPRETRFPNAGVFLSQTDSLDRAPLGRLLYARFRRSYISQFTGGCVYLLKVANKGVFVILPVALQSLFRRKLFAAELHGDLEAVAAQVIEVLHSCQDTKWKVSVCLAETRHRLLC